MLVVLGASLLGAFVKSVTGMGYPVLAVPLIAVPLGIEDAVVIVAAPNLAANALLAFGARSGRGGARDLPRLLGWGILGAAIGTVALVSVPETPLLVALGCTIVAFVGRAVARPDHALDPVVARRWSPVVGAGAGLMQGAIGVSGPIVAGWVQGYRLTKDAYVFTVTTIFGITGAVQLVLLAASGAYTVERSAVSALAFVPVLAMLPIGSRLRDRLGGAAFDRAVLAVIVASGIAVFLDAFA